MAAFLLVMKRGRKRLIGPLYLMGPIQSLCRKVFSPKAKPPPLVQAQSPTSTPVLHPLATRSAEPHPLPLTESLMLLPPVLPDLPSLLLFITLLLPDTRRRRIPALHARPQGPKLADHLWMPNSLPSSSSSSGTMLEEPTAEKTLHWASSMYNHKVSLSPLSSSMSTRATTPRTIMPQVIMASSDQVTILVLFLHRGAN